MMPRPDFKERTLGNVAGLGDKLNGTVPQRQVRHNTHVADVPVPQESVVVRSHISCSIYARVERTREVKADCYVWKDIKRDIDAVKFLAPNDSVVEDLLRAIMQKRCKVKQFAGVFQNTDPGDLLFRRVGMEIDDVMQYFRRRLVYHGHQSSVCSIEEGEVEDDVFLGRSVEKTKHKTVVNQHLCAILDTVCDVDAPDLIGIVKGLSGEERMIELSTPVSHH